MPTPTGNWYVRLTDGNAYPFYHGIGVENPLEERDWFDRNDEWSLDIPELRDRYPADPEDNSFVLVPKEDVEDVFFDRYGEPSRDRGQES